MRGATRCKKQHYGIGSVSIHAPVRGATGHIKPPARIPACFNPRARAGRDPCRLSLSQYRFPVSIHAPVRGATDRRAGARDPGPVSIHAPVRGATDRTERVFPHLGVSIHAPVRGATLSSCLWISHPLGFNPRARAGRDAISDPIFCKSSCFNPRARAGRDYIRSSRRRRRSGFQSTRPCGARHHVALLKIGDGIVSIHAPVRGATSICSCNI